MRRWWSLILIAVVVGSGCASAAGVGTARVLESGEDEVSFGAELGAGFPKLTPTRPAVLPWPQLGVGYRRGIAPVDVGARMWGFLIRGLYTFGTAVDVKVPIVKSESVERGWDLTVDPGVGYHQVNSGGAPVHQAIFRLPVLIGFNFRGGDQLVVGPRIDDHVMFATDVNTVNLFFFGTSLGYSWRVTDALSIRPEAVLLHSRVGFNGTRDDPDRKGLTVMQFNLSAAIGL